MFGSYLKFLITFFFIYHIFYMFLCKTHFAAVYPLQRVLLISRSLKDKNWGASSQQQVTRALPKCEAPPSSSLEEEEAELRGHGQDTRQAAARWAALQTLYSCFLHGIPKKVMWLSPGDESTFCNTGIKLHCTGKARMNQVLRTLFFTASGKIWAHTFIKLHWTIM